MNKIVAIENINSKGFAISCEMRNFAPSNHILWN